MGGQWPAAPVQGDLGEQPVFNLVTSRCPAAGGRPTYGNQRRELGFPRPAPGPFAYTPPEKRPGEREGPYGTTQRCRSTCRLPGELTLRRGETDVGHGRVAAEGLPEVIQPEQHPVRPTCELGCRVAGHCLRRHAPTRASGDQLVPTHRSGPVSFGARRRPRW